MRTPGARGIAVGAAVFGAVAIASVCRTELEGVGRATPVEQFTSRVETPDWSEQIGPWERVGAVAVALGVSDALRTGGDVCVGVYLLNPTQREVTITTYRWDNTYALRIWDDMGNQLTDLEGADVFGERVVVLPGPVRKQWITLNPGQLFRFTLCAVANNKRIGPLTPGRYRASLDVSRVRWLDMAWGDRAPSDRGVWAKRWRPPETARDVAAVEFEVE